jgi:hypothetical protein
MTVCCAGRTGLQQQSSSPPPRRPIPGADAALSRVPVPRRRDDQHLPYGIGSEVAPGPAPCAREGAGITAGSSAGRRRCRGSRPGSSRGSTPPWCQSSTRRRCFVLGSAGRVGAGVATDVVTEETWVDVRLLNAAARAVDSDRAAHPRGGVDPTVLTGANWGSTQYTQLVVLPLPAPKRRFSSTAPAVSPNGPCQAGRVRGTAWPRWEAGREGPAATRST